MTYKKYKLALTIRVIVLFLTLTSLAYFINIVNFKSTLHLTWVIIFLVIIVLYLFYTIYDSIFKRFNEIDNFFEAISYRDFSRHFNEQNGVYGIRELHKKFNSVNTSIRELYKEKEVQHLHLKKIVNLIDTGIIAYNLTSKDVLWVNDSFKRQLDIPSIKNIQFIEKRTPKIYYKLFSKNYVNDSNVNVIIDNKKTSFLVSSSTFKAQNESFKLIVIKNIADTLNRTESEAWKKLLSVMTHEIMNSITPISSLAETLHAHITAHNNNPAENLLDIDDLNIGIDSIKKRSIGLLSFAKTYRSLNKVTELNLSKVSIKELFNSIETLLLPSLKNKLISVFFEIDNESIQIKMDPYLIEQVLINLILNATASLEGIQNPKIIVKAKINSTGQPTIHVIDNGKGIPDEIIDQVFIPFFTTKKTGSGIGLSLCKQIMLLHKGEITINSIENTGTVVNLFF
ncbi:sensor histidine kinase [Aquimarina agarilytica]|uniref:sensor histidine kinase n=1 Tax=Aquimarina agarilytica TaxID=1087449 RepID=UPI000288686C|nr:HAMP domain-containing sensor histidine kinase [Aquimarina agarilytica]